MNPHARQPKEKAPTVASGQGFENQGKTNKLNSEGNTPAEQDPAFAHARAKLAQAGWLVRRVDAGAGLAAYLVSRWGLSRTLPDWHALGQFMRQVGCKP